MFRPRAKEKIANRITASVVVRIPPPTLEGLAPINIKKESNNWLGTPNFVISMVVNPVLRALTE